MNSSIINNRSKNRLILLFLFMFSNSASIFSQGYNHAWLLGHDAGFIMGKLNFTSNSYTLTSEQRLMTFYQTQANISDANGNFLMSSNGVWIANANNQVMMNGSGLNPNSFTNANSNGLPLTYANLILPYPGDTNKFVLFHHSAAYDGYSYPNYQILQTIIDITLDNGLGGVIFKNDTLIQDTLNWGLAACRHSNGQDWWIVCQKHDSDIIYKILLTTNGIENITTEQLNVPNAWYNVTQLTFSPDGKKFAYTIYDTTSTLKSVVLLDFNRCSGMFSSPVIIPVIYHQYFYLWGISFSPNSQFIYTCTPFKIYQINADTADIPASLIEVAVNDTFYSPFPPFQTDFRLMYLAANGKIYITSGNGVQHHHFINEPNLSGLSSDVQQHGLDLNGIWNFRSVPNHPNYYLGCDTTCTPCLIPPVGINEVLHDFRFNIYPNPSSGNFNIIYLLPQNKEGKLEVFDITGKVVYEMRLPQWSTLQQISLPAYISNGLYNCVITSDNNRVSKKIAIIRD
jgi:hypothetical protein